jgi:DNA-binding CsgD family transcriptional regulator
MNSRPGRVRRSSRRFLVDPRSDGFAALLSVTAIAAAFLLGLILGPERHADRFVPGVVVSAVLAGTRYVALRRDLGAWIIPLDGIACFAVVAWTSAPLSEFHFVALAGVWWAGRLVTRRGAALFAAAFLAPYLVVVLPDGWRRGYFAEAVDDVLTVAVIAVLIDWFMGVDRRVVALSTALHTAEARQESAIELRRRLALAAGESPLPVDALVAAGQLGLTANQIELLGYLQLGFGNAHIADAVGRSEATVRYRLTGLYRALGVSGRAAAIERARDLGLGSIAVDDQGQ